MAKRFEDRNQIHFPQTPEGAFEEMKELSKGAGRTLDISGMSYEKIEAARGIQWPYSEAQAHLDEQKIGKLKGFDMKQRQDFLGNPRLYTDGVFQTADGRANLIP